MTDLDGELREFERIWNAADGGDIDRMRQLADLCDGEMRERWLRRASDGGHLQASITLAKSLVNKRRLEEAAVLFQRAADGGARHVIWYLAMVLLASDRPDDAERWARRAVEAYREPARELGFDFDKPNDEYRNRFDDEGVLVRALVDELERRGKTIEATALRSWSERTGPDPDKSEVASWLTDLEGAWPAALPAVVLTAVVSVGVVPFAKALMTKAGENSYSEARALVRWLFRRGRAKKQDFQDERNKLLIVEDPNPRLNLAIWLGTDTSDEQLRALKDLDVDGVVSDARHRNARGVRIQWDERNRSWRVMD